MVITISKDLEEELNKTFKIMDEFSKQMYNLEELTSIKLERERRREIEVKQKYFIIDK